jgi:hypothetical protein
VLAAEYAHVKVPVASVAAELRTDNFTIVPLLNKPVNVLTVRTLTWMCAPKPHGPNVHAGTLGYPVIADAVVAAVEQVLRTG